MEWYRNRRVATKLLLAFGVVLTFTAGLGLFAMARFGMVDEATNVIADTWLPATRVAAELRAAETDFRLNEFAHVLATDAATKAERATEMKDLQASIEDLESRFPDGASTAKGKDGFDGARRAWDAYVAGHDRTLELSREGSPEAMAMLASREDAFRKALEAAKVVEDHTSEGSEAAQTRAEQEVVSARRWLMGGMILVLVLGFSFALGIANLISGPIRMVVERAERLRSFCITNLGEAADGLAKGDLTVSVETTTQPLEITTADEVGDLARSINGIIHETQATVASFGAATAAMRTALMEVRGAADTTAASAQELQSSSEEISSGAQEQASNLEETAASLEEMTSSVKQNADSAQQASQLAEGARDVAEKGGRVVGEAVGAMREITTASKRIADITTTIDEIAFQTNILALNAAVEAARAGQQGRGFAVVAGEVRKLAQRSASAAKEIKCLIQDSAQKVDGGTELVEQSGTALEEIVVSVKRVSDIVAEMAAASREQASGIDQVNRAVVQMDSVTQANAGQTEELAGTAEGLAAQAEQLQQLVGRFKVEDGVPGADEGGTKPNQKAVESVTKKVTPVPSRSFSGNGNGNGRRMAVAAVEERMLPDLDEFEEY